MSSTGFVNGSTLTDAGWFNDTDTVTYRRLTSVTGTNTIVGTGPVSLTAYALGQEFDFIPQNTNTGPATINITPSGASALGAKNIFWNGAALVGGEIIVNIPCKIFYDGTQFNILSNGGMLAGASTQTFSPNGRINTQTSTGGIGNGADTTDDTLFTYTTPANAMVSNGNTVRVRFGGSTGATGNNKTFKVWFGGVAMFTTAVVTDNNANVCIDVEIVRLSATKVQATGTYISSSGSTAIRALADVQLNKTVSDLTANTSIIKVTGASPTTGAANDCIGYTMATYFYN